jgi:hypothetical protein
MKPGLSKRLGKLKLPTLLRMWEYKGPYELVNWWEHFIRDIPEDADFADLDRKKQELILSWEKDISMKKSTKDKNITSQGSCEQ